MFETLMKAQTFSKSSDIYIWSSPWCQVEPFFEWSQMALVQLLHKETCGISWLQFLLCMGNENGSWSCYMLHVWPYLAKRNTVISDQPLLLYHSPKQSLYQSGPLLALGDKGCCPLLHTAHTVAEGFFVVYLHLLCRFKPWHIGITFHIRDTVIS